MADIERPSRYTATVVFPVVWDWNMMSKETVTYTTTYIGPTGSHTLWARVSNPAVEIPQQTMVVGMPFTMEKAGATYALTVPATVAAHSATQRDPKPTTLATVLAKSPEAGAAEIVNEGLKPSADGRGSKGESVDFTSTSRITLGLILFLVLALLHRRFVRSRLGRIRIH